MAEQQTDPFKENDQFVPLITRAGSNVIGATGRLESKDLDATWKDVRGDILSAIRASQSSTVVHIGFSMKTCTPASMICFVVRKWISGGSRTWTASSFSLASISSREP